MEREELVLELKELAVRFSEGWHEGIKIDALDIMLLNKAAEALAQPAQEPAIGDIRALKHRIHELEGEVIGYKRILDAQPAQEQNFCERCGKRTADLTTIHTCTPPQGANNA